MPKNQLHRTGRKRRSGELGTLEALVAKEVTMIEPGDYTQLERKCHCGTALLFHCKARNGLIVGRRVGVCPDCGTEHDLPGEALRVFRKVEGKWVPA